MSDTKSSHMSDTKSSHPQQTVNQSNTQQNNGTSLPSQQYLSTSNQQNQNQTYHASSNLQENYSGNQDSKNQQKQINKDYESQTNNQYLEQSHQHQISNISNRQQIIFDHIKFKNTLNDKLKNELITKQVYQILQSNFKWEINDKYFQHNWHILFSYIKQTSIIILEFSLTKNSSIILDISQPIFNKLKIIELGFNRINTIQALSFIHTQKLETLFLNHNQITLTKSINKINWPHMEYLTIHFNKITQFHLNRTKFNKIFKSLRLASKVRFFEKNQINNLCYIKLPFNKIEMIRICREDRIDQRKAIEALRRKYENIKSIQ